MPLGYRLRIADLCGNASTTLKTQLRFEDAFDHTCAVHAQEEGSAGVERWLAAEAEAALPEFKRKRPKYYYYYEWMRERIAGHCGALPEPVLDKLLTLEGRRAGHAADVPQRGAGQGAPVACICGTPPVGWHPNMLLSGSSSLQRHQAYACVQCSHLHASIGRASGALQIACGHPGDNAGICGMWKPKAH